MMMKNKILTNKYLNLHKNYEKNIFNFNNTNLFNYFCKGSGWIRITFQWSDESISDDNPAGRMS